MHLNPTAISPSLETKHNISFTYKVKQFGSGPGKSRFWFQTAAYHLTLAHCLLPSSVSKVLLFFFNFLFYIEV